MEHFDALVIGVDEAEIIHALLDEMAGVVIDVAARMIADALEEHFERVAVEQILGRMNLEAEIDARRIIGVEDRLPAARLFVETFLDQPGGPLRIGIEVRPGERAREGDMFGEAEAL